MIVWIMFDAEKWEWVERRIRERDAERHAKRIEVRTPGVVVIDAGRFIQQITDLAQTLIFKLEREGRSVFGSHEIQADIAAILIQLCETYNLLRFVYGDDTRYRNSGFRLSYIFVVLPLVRTMIDGFYNCTAMLDDPSRVRQFRVSGLYRLRESIKADEQRYGSDPAWKRYLLQARQDFEYKMRLEGFRSADLDDNGNKWPLLGVYLNAKPTSAHKQMLSRMTLGFWKEYSSISHASHDGILSILPYITINMAPHEVRPSMRNHAERLLAMHISRAAGVLLCLLTEIQWFCKFDGDRVDERLSEIWAAMQPVFGVKELYDYRYNTMLRHKMKIPPAT